VKINTILLYDLEKLSFHPCLCLLHGQGITEGLGPNGRFSKQFTIQHADPALSKTKFAASRGLKVLLRGNTYWLDGVGFTPDQNGTFIAPVDNAVVIVMLIETGLGSG
jgi:hypothetical protein